MNFEMELKKNTKSGRNSPPDCLRLTENVFINLFLLKGPSAGSVRQISYSSELSATLAALASTSFCWISEGACS